MTTREEILAVLKPGERISYLTLLSRLQKSGGPARGIAVALDDAAFIRRWNTGEEYSPFHVYEEKSRGPLYIERALTVPR